MMARYNATATPTGFAEMVRDDFRCISNAPRNAIRYGKFYSRSHHAVIRVYDDAAKVIETHEQAGDFQEPLSVATPHEQRRHDTLRDPDLVKRCVASTRRRRFEESIP